MKAIKKISFCLLLAVLVLALPVSLSHAAVVLEADFSGTIVVDLPDGEMLLLEAGDPIPEIPSEATIEIFDGEITVSTGPEDTVEVVCLQHYVTLGGGGSVSVQCGDESGLVKVKKGRVRLVDAAEREVDLEEGTEYPIQLGGPEEGVEEKTGEAVEEAPPVEAGEELGGPGMGGDVGDVEEPSGRDITEGLGEDTRDQQTSPSF
ncbi:MAG: hypothetical protein JW893_08410 [Candidatus Omnitrophica bacterium]|nr:hypothetical protein [Candidatus Omnitrophota bacterium]